MAIELESTFTVQVPPEQAWDVLLDVERIAPCMPAARVRDMRHRGVSIEEIARLVGHASTRTTEIVYRRELRPVITTGAEIMDQLFTQTQPPPKPASRPGPAQLGRRSPVT
jgi:hypothetical protein